MSRYFKFKDNSGVNYLNYHILKDGRKLSESKFNELLEKSEITKDQLLTSQKDLLQKFTYESTKKGVELFNEIRENVNLSASLKSQLINKLVREPYTLENIPKMEKDIDENISDKKRLDTIKRAIWKNPLLIFDSKKDLHTRIENVIEKGIKVYNVKIKFQADYKRKEHCKGKDRNGKRIIRKQAGAGQRVSLEITIDNFKTHTLNSIDIGNRLVNPIFYFFIENLSMSNDLFESQIEDVVRGENIKIVYEGEEYIQEPLIESKASVVGVIKAPGNYTSKRQGVISINMEGQNLEW